jgi:diadenosine tetraphosphate (Ap4A) HIT family hydrolase
MHFIPREKIDGENPPNPLPKVPLPTPGTTRVKGWEKKIEYVRPQS